MSRDTDAAPAHRVLLLLHHDGASAQLSITGTWSRVGSAVQELAHLATSGGGRPGNALVGMSPSALQSQAGGPFGAATDAAQVVSARPAQRLRCRCRRMGERPGDPINTVGRRCGIRSSGCRSPGRGAAGSAVHSSCSAAWRGSGGRGGRCRWPWRTCRRARCRWRIRRRPPPPPPCPAAPPPSTPSSIRRRAPRVCSVSDAQPPLHSARPATTRSCCTVASGARVPPMPLRDEACHAGLRGPCNVCRWSLTLLVCCRQHATGRFPHRVAEQPGGHGRAALPDPRWPHNHQPRSACCLLPCRACMPRIDRTAC